MDKEEINQIWFDFYVDELRKSPKYGHKKFGEYFLCPCCYFPTLSERQAFDICFLCDWEDDGQDDHNADLVLGGPNHSYSLTEARKNFVNYLTSYRPADKYPFELSTAKKDPDGKIVFDVIVYKKQIIEKYRLAMYSSTLALRKQLLGEVGKLRKTMTQLRIKA